MLQQKLSPVVFIGEKGWGHGLVKLFVSSTAMRHIFEFMKCRIDILLNGPKVEGSNLALSNHFYSINSLIWDQLHLCNLNQDDLRKYQSHLEPKPTISRKTRYTEHLKESWTIQRSSLHSWKSMNHNLWFMNWEP